MMQSGNFGHRRHVTARFLWGKVEIETVLSTFSSVFEPFEQVCFFAGRHVRWRFSFLASGHVPRWGRVIALYSFEKEIGRAHV